MGSADWKSTVAFWRRIIINLLSLYVDLALTVGKNACAACETVWKECRCRLLQFFLAKIVSFHLKFQNKVTVNFLHPSICELLFFLLQFARNVSSCKFPHKVESKKDKCRFSTAPVRQAVTSTDFKRQKAVTPSVLGIDSGKNSNKPSLRVFDSLI